FLHDRQEQEDDAGKARNDEVRSEGTQARDLQGNEAEVSPSREGRTRGRMATSFSWARAVRRQSVEAIAAGCAAFSALTTPRQPRAPGSGRNTMRACCRGRGGREPVL